MCNNDGLRCPVLRLGSPAQKTEHELGQRGLAFVNYGGDDGWELGLEITLKNRVYVDVRGHDRSRFWGLKTMRA